MTKKNADTPKANIPTEMKGMSDNTSSTSQLLLLDAAEEMKPYPKLHVEDASDMEANMTKE